MNVTSGQVIDRPDRQRFELEVEGETAIADYRREDSTIVFTHTEVPAALKGQGIASKLIAGALAKVRADGLKIVPLCPFVRKYVEQHPETQDLLA